MSTTIGSAHTMPQKAERAPAPGRRFASARLPLFMYFSVVLLTCAWVMSLAVFPSQDEPLHLYYVNIFGQLLHHEHTNYTAHYVIRHLFPPYATYYYALLGLSHFAGLEDADKLFICGCIFLFAVAGWLLVRTVSPASRWAPLLLLPVLLNWPTFMGFANYMFSVDLACLALAVWWKARDTSDLRFSVLFLLLVLGMVFTHPIPWIVTIGFAACDVALRFLRRSKAGISRPKSGLMRDAVVVVLACLPYPYLAHYRAATQIISKRVFDQTSGTWKLLQHPTLFQRLYDQYLSVLHTDGLVLFLGPGTAEVYRLGLDFLLDGVLLVALWSIWTRSRRVAWREQDLWLLYTALFLLALIVIPDEFAGGYFFTKRMQILLYVFAVVAASDALQRFTALAAGTAFYATALSLFTLSLAVSWISPVSQSILSLRDLPLASADGRPGLLVRPVDVAFPSHLNFDSYNWAPVDYIRWHDLLLFNTSWLGEPLVPIGLRPEALSSLDATYFNQAPQFGDPPMADESDARHLFSKAGFIVIQRMCKKKSQNVFAEEGGSSKAGPFSEGWHCRTGANGEWYLCQPAEN